MEVWASFETFGVFLAWIPSFCINPTSLSLFLENEKLPISLLFIPKMPPFISIPVESLAKIEQKLGFSYLKWFFCFHDFLEDIRK